MFLEKFKNILATMCEVSFYCSRYRTHGHGGDLDQKNDPLVSVSRVANNTVRKVDPEILAH